MKLESQVLVLGGGIVGLSAALAMAQRGQSVAIIDSGLFKVDDLGTDIRVYAINKASQTLLMNLGAWQHLDALRISPYSHMHVWEAVHGAHIDFDSRVVAAPNLGYIMEESVLKKALLKQISLQTNIHLFPESFVEKIETEGHGVSLSTQQQTWTGQLLMIADGANSPARQKLKVPLTTWSYEHHALVATVAVEKPHQQTAYQVFHPDGPLAFLPLVDPHHCSIVWSTNQSKINKLMTFADQEFNDALTQASGNQLGQVKIISTKHQFPLRMRHVKQYAGKRWLLLGDAAHTIHPLAGLGLNIGLADVGSWIQCLNTANVKLSSQKALGAYQRERKHAVWQIILLMEGFKRLFSNSFTPFVTFRSLGLSLCNELTPLKRFFIQQASGNI